MTTDLVPDADESEADYFRAILVMQNAAEQSRALPAALSELILCIQTILDAEGAKWVFPKPIFLNASELAAFGATERMSIFQHRADDIEWVIACDQAAITGLATILLGGKPAFAKRAASRIESQIALGFFKLMNAGFKQLDPAQPTMTWQDYAGAKLAFYEASDSPYLIVMINQRADSALKPQTKAPDVEQKNHLRRVLGQGVLNVDYVLAGGQVSLAILRNLVPGSVLPLGRLEDLSLDARANGKTIQSGVLKLSPDHMRFGITSVLAEANYD